MSHSLTDFSTKKARLTDRAFMLKIARDFFFSRHIIEVDCPILSKQASVDAHIDLISANYQKIEKYYLHSSPEIGMKRLLVEGMRDIYQLSHVFRDNEWSHKHNPEFMMAEWYRLDFTLEQLISETLDFIQLFLGKLSFKIMSYRDVFLHFTQIDYVHASEDDLFAYICNKDISYYASLREEGKDALLNLILGTLIEPHLGQNELFVLTNYPASQAALAKKIEKKDELVAKRFEVYYQGIELANGYHELGDVEEQVLRFKEANDQRVSLGKETLPIDDFFIQALKIGLPNCCGVAVGFDRLMMLRQNQKNIENVIPFGWKLV